jgi:5,10-methylene-tetrahydrofolate dehydrogenase/methenyl tetrahydrofolate cyclohydrolase
VLPLPVQIDEQKVLMAVCPSKMLMGFIQNFGKWLDMSTFIPATPFWDFRIIRTLWCRDKESTQSLWS